MITGLDSSFARPTLAQAQAARAAGVRIWGGYLASMDGLGLATRWSRADFAVVQEAGLRAIGFCSGWDDPVWIRDTAAAWGILVCVDVEPGIRDDGPWIQGWVRTAACGLYGLASVHYWDGEPVGRDAAFNIVADYLAVGCTGETWPSWLPRPARCGWQCRGDHQEFGLEVDRGSYDDWFLGEEDMTDDQAAKLDRIHDVLFTGRSDGTPTGVPGPWGIADGQGGDRLSAILARLDALSQPAVDLKALALDIATDLAPHLPVSVDPEVVADKVEARLAAQFAKP